MLRSLKINKADHLRREMQGFEVDPIGIKIMLDKGEFQVLKTLPLPPAGCNILKQQMLSVGGEVAIARGCANCTVDKRPAIIMGTRKQFLELIRSLEYQCFGLKELQQELEEYFNRATQRYFKIGPQKFDLSQKTLVMGIVNYTPDSFSDGGKYNNIDLAFNRAMQLLEVGADIIDIGGESTRPGAQKIDTETEIRRVVPVIEKLRGETDAPISIDTYKSDVAVRAIEAGASIVNDISGLNFDEKMASVIAEKGVSAVLMHIQGTPDSMQKNPVYENMIDEILAYLVASAGQLIDRKVEKDRIAIDPGIGFGKISDKNFDLIRYLEEFKSAGFPVLVGPSRKSFIGNLLELPVEERLEGTLAAVACSIMNGADIVRVHDVKETCRAVKIADKITGKN